MERRAKRISVMLLVMVRARRAMGLPALVSLLEHLESYRLQVLQGVICREAMGSCGCVLAWDVIGGWFMLEGSSAEDGSVMCASVRERGDSGQTDLEKFLRGLSSAVTSHWEGYPPAPAAVLTLQQQRQ